MRYPVVIHKDSESDYGVTVPDLPGCFSGGNTVDEALAAAAEAIECHIEGLLLDGQPVPMPEGIEYHQHNPDYADGIWAIVGWIYPNFLANLNASILRFPKDR